MDQELKKRLIEAVEKVYDKRAKVQVKFAAAGKEDPEKCAKNAQLMRGNCTFFAQKTRSFLYAAIQRKLADRRLWRRIEKALAQDAIERMFTEMVRQHQRSTEDEAQLCLPGFDYLPKRIRSGRESLVFAKATVAQFLKYKERYEQRSEKDHRVVEELQRLAQTVKRLAGDETSITIGEALSREKGSETALRLVVG
jgi:hypothetical protein